MSNSLLPTPIGISWSVHKKPTFSNLVQRSAAGREVRAALWVYPIYEWDLTYEYLPDDSTDALKTYLGFFLQRQGAYDSFLYADPNDTSVTDQSIGTGNGSNQDFQLVRTYGGFTEPVYDIAASPAPVIKVNGVTKSTPADYTINSTGMVHFTSAPGGSQPVTATFTYYWRVRFKEDAADFENFAYKLFALKRITLLGVKT